MVSPATEPLALVVGIVSPIIKSPTLAAAMTSLMTGRSTSFIGMVAFATRLQHWLLSFRLLDPRHQLSERRVRPLTSELATKWVKGSHSVLLKDVLSKF